MTKITCKMRFFLAVALALGTGSPAEAKRPLPNQLDGVGITEHLGRKISLNELTFANELGEKKQLSEYFKKGKPVVLNMVYYQCPSLCNFVMNGLLSSLRGFKWMVGNEFEIVSVSIDHREKPGLAAAKKKTYLKNYGRLGAEKGWHFLTGEKDQIKKLADEVGFGFKYDDQQKEYAHGAALIVLTPDGKISRYLYGIEYPKKDLRLSLLEASSGKIGNVVDRVLLFCYRYDPESRGYALFATNLMKAGGATTVLAIGIYMFSFWRRQRQKPAVKS